LAERTADKQPLGRPVQCVGDEAFRFGPGFLAKRKLNRFGVRCPSLPWKSSVKVGDVQLAPQHPIVLVWNVSLLKLTVKSSQAQGAVSIRILLQ
jgi:hypothetical protein